jgi:hypothetical protein
VDTEIRPPWHLSADNKVSLRQHSSYVFGKKMKIGDNKVFKETTKFLPKIMAICLALPKCPVLTCRLYIIQYRTSHSNV